MKRTIQASTARTQAYTQQQAQFKEALHGGGIMIGHALQLSAINEAAESITGNNQLWRVRGEQPYPTIRRVIMLLMHNDRYTDEQIAAFLGCKRSNVTIQRAKCLSEITGNLQDKFVVAYYNAFKNALKI